MSTAGNPGRPGFTGETYGRKLPVECGTIWCPDGERVRCVCVRAPGHAGPHLDLSGFSMSGGATGNLTRPGAANPGRPGFTGSTSGERPGIDKSGFQEGGHVDFGGTIQQTTVHPKERQPKRNDGGSAFPTLDELHGYDFSGIGKGAGYTAVTAGGMTLLDYFAGQALIGMLASYANPNAVALPEAGNKLAEDAYCYAYGMLAAREREDAS